MKQKIKICILDIILICIVYSFTQQIITLHKPQPMLNKTNQIAVIRIGENNEKYEYIQIDNNHPEILKHYLDKWKRIILEPTKNKSRNEKAEITITTYTDSGEVLEHIIINYNYVIKNKITYFYAENDANLYYILKDLLNRKVLL